MINSGTHKRRSRRKKRAAKSRKPCDGRASLYIGWLLLTVQEFVWTCVPIIYLLVVLVSARRHNPKQLPLLVAAFGLFSVYALLVVLALRKARQAVDRYRPADLKPFFVGKALKACVLGIVIAILLIFNRWELHLIAFWSAEILASLLALDILWKTYGVLQASRERHCRRSVHARSYPVAGSSHV